MPALPMLLASLLFFSEKPMRKCFPLPKTGSATVTRQTRTAVRIGPNTCSQLSQEARREDGRKLCFHAAPESSNGACRVVAHPSVHPYGVRGIPEAVGIVGNTRPELDLARNPVLQTILSATRLQHFKRLFSSGPGHCWSVHFSAALPMLGNCHSADFETIVLVPVLRGFVRVQLALLVCGHCVAGMLRSEVLLQTLSLSLPELSSPRSAGVPAAMFVSAAWTVWRPQLGDGRRDVCVFFRSVLRTG